MNNEKYEFFQDTREKSITARSARNKKTHTGKGGRVRLPSDNLTKKEREAMNGECKSYRMNDPISWKEFKTWPDEHKKTYIKLIRKKYGAPDAHIAKMFGVERSALCNLVKKLGINTGDRSNRKGIWDKDGFYAWWGGVSEGVVKHSETPIEEEPVDIHEDDGLVVICEGPEIVTPEMEAKLHELIKDDINVPENDADQLLKETEEDESNENNRDDVLNKLREASHEGIIVFESNTVVPYTGEMTFQGNVDDILRTIAKLLDGRQVKLEVEWEVLE